MATADVQEIRATSYVGFDTITQQIEHKLLKRGFQFNVIVVGPSVSPSRCIRVTRVFLMYFLGQTGLGKSTLINTIFASHLIDSKGRREADEPVRQTTEIQTVSHSAVPSKISPWILATSLMCKCFFVVITENGVRLRLNIVDTPGYGDQVDNENWYVTLFCSYLGFDRNVKFVAGTRL